MSINSRIEELESLILEGLETLEFCYAKLDTKSLPRVSNFALNLRELTLYSCLVRAEDGETTNVFHIGLSNSVLSILSDI